MRTKIEGSFGGKKYLIGSIITPFILSSFILIIFYFLNKIDKIGFAKKISVETIKFTLISIAIGYIIYLLDNFILKLEFFIINKIFCNQSNKKFLYGMSFQEAVTMYSSNLFLITLIVTSFWEELCFRGVGLFVFLESLNFPSLLGVGFTSIAFAIYHISSGYLSIFPKFIGGIILGLLYVFTKSLLHPFIAHITWNFFIWIDWKKSSMFRKGG